MNINGLKKACLALAIVSLAACGDSTGSGTVTPEEALRSLNRGLGEGGGFTYGLGAGSLGGAGNLGTVDVTIDGSRRSMYALGLRTTFPSGTCDEDIFDLPGEDFYPTCTPPIGLVLVLWETRSGSRAPDRMIFLSADVGTSDFSFVEDYTQFPAFAFYVDRGGEGLWFSKAGTLTSQVTATNQTCAVPPPPFAETSTCHFATFDEAGQITFEEFNFDGDFGPVSSARTIQLVIPRQNILGIWQDITAVRPITIFRPAVRGF